MSSKFEFKLFRANSASPAEKNEVQSLVSEYLADADGVEIQMAATEYALFVGVLKRIDDLECK